MTEKEMKIWLLFKIMQLSLNYQISFITELFLRTLMFYNNSSYIITKKVYINFLHPNTYCENHWNYDYHIKCMILISLVNENLFLHKNNVTQFQQKGFQMAVIC